MLVRMPRLRSLVVASAALGLLGLGLLTVATGLLEPARAPAQEPITRLRIGWGAAGEPVKYIMMRKPEILKNYGRAYTVDWVAFSSPVAQGQALASGQLDGGTLGAVALGRHAAVGGNDLRVVAGISEERPGSFATAWVVASATGLAKVGDLKGRTIGTAARGEYANLVARGVLRKHGLDPDRDVKIVEVAAAAMDESLRRGQIAAAELAQPAYTTAHRRGGVRDLFTSLELFDAGAVLVQVFRADVIDRKPEAIRAFLEDWAAAGEWMSAHRGEALDVYASVTRQPRDLLALYLLTARDRYYPPDGLPNVAALQAVFDLLTDGREIGKRLDARALTDLRAHPRAAR